VLSIADVDRLLTQAKASASIPEQSPLQTLRALRLSCLLEILYATGLRVSNWWHCRCLLPGAMRA
jgi:integrase/recombinase XerD